MVTASPSGPLFPDAYRRAQAAGEPEPLPDVGRWRRTALLVAAAVALASWPVWELARAGVPERIARVLGLLGLLGGGGP